MGFGKVLAHECSEMWGGLVDLDHKGQQGLSKLFNLVRSDKPCTTLAAIRHGDLYALRLIEKTKLEKGNNSVQILPEKTYLIAGGSGGLGRLLTKWLVEQGQTGWLL